VRAEPLDVATLESAALWYVDLRSDLANGSLQAAHRQWLERDPRHRQAWDRVLRLQGAFDGLSHPALARATIRGASARRREVLKVLSVLLAAGALGTFGWRSAGSAPWLADHRTATGERRRLHLEDGTELLLNTATAVNIRYSQALREVALLAGEIRVQTARDPGGRPFVVHTEEGSMRALGTRFVVLRDAAATRLSVIEQAVEVRLAQQPANAVTVKAGQQVSFSAGALGDVTTADPQIDAWTRDMLIVSNWRLGDFIRQLQRYRPGYLSCDPAVAGLRISGAFNLASTDAVLENLRNTLPVRTRQFTAWWVRVEAA
jgi:transmembrane sensor